MIACDNESCRFQWVSVAPSHRACPSPEADDDDDAAALARAVPPLVHQREAGVVAARRVVLRRVPGEVGDPDDVHAGAASGGDGRGPEGAEETVAAILIGLGPGPGLGLVVLLLMDMNHTTYVKRTRRRWGNERTERVRVGLVGAGLGKRGVRTARVDTSKGVWV